MGGQRKEGGAGLEFAEDTRIANKDRRVVEGGLAIMSGPRREKEHKNILNSQGS